MLTLLILLGGLAQAPTSAAPAQPVNVFLGPVPSEHGFVAASKGFEESYRDIRAEFAKNRSFQKDIKLVDTLEQADLAVEIVFRGLEDSGTRTGSATAVGSVAIANSRPVLQKRLRGRLLIHGTDYSVPVDGAAGLKLLTYSNQARNVLVLVRDWINANREVLAKVRR